MKHFVHPVKQKGMLLGVPRILFIMVVAFGSLMSTGLLFGWPSLVIMLRDEGIFSSLCTNQTSVLNSTLNSTISIHSCSDQDFGFSLAFTFGTISVYIGQFVFGFGLDLIGPKILHVGCSLLLAISSLMIVFTPCMSSFLTD